MARFKVRSGFFVHLGEQVFEPGVELELDDAQFALVAHQVEPVAEVKPAQKAKAVTTNPKE